MRSRTSIALLAVGVLALSACSEGGSPGTDGDLSEIRIASSFENIGSNAPFIMGEAKGYFEEEGLRLSIAAVQTDPRSFLIGGSADVAQIELSSVAQGVAEGLDLVIFGGFRCREEFAFAVQSNIERPEDLAGQPVFLNGRPGIPIVDYRMSLLAEAGWDISNVDVDFIDIPSGGREPTELFAADRIDLLYFYSSDLEPLTEANAKIIYDDYSQWPNEVLVTTRAWLDANPEKAEGLLRGMMQALDDYLDPANKAEFLGYAEAEGYDMRGADADHEASQYVFCSNLYLNADEFAEQLSVQGVPNPPSFEELANVTALLAAQESLGLNNEVELTDLLNPAQGRVTG